MRNTRIFSLPVFCLSFLIAATAAQADQVVLKNGDRLTGAIVKKQDAGLTIKTEQMGAVTVPWDQVESVAADTPVYVVPAAGPTLHGTLTLEGDKAEVKTADAVRELAFGDISAIRDDAEEKAYQRLLNPGWLQLWTGTGTVGFAGTSGNARTLTFTTGINADRRTRSDKTSIYFSLIKASARIDDVSEDTAEAVRGGISYGRDITPRLFFSAFNDYEYDRFQNLDLRFVLGGGMGYHAIANDRVRLDLLGGGAYNRSSFSTPLIRESGEIYWGDELSIKLNSAASLVQSYRMFNDMTNSGMYRVNFDLGLNTKLLKWLTWNISISDRYLSDPAPGRQNNDFMYTTGLGITFAN